MKHYQLEWVKWAKQSDEKQLTLTLFNFELLRDTQSSTTLRPKWIKGKDLPSERAADAFVQDLIFMFQIDCTFWGLSNTLCLLEEISQICAGLKISSTYLGLWD